MAGSVRLHRRFQIADGLEFSDRLVEVQAEGTIRRDLDAMQARNARLRAENERLAREAEALRSQSRAIERVARADLGWVRPGEVVFDLGKGP